MGKYVGLKTLAGERDATYMAVKKETDKLKDLFSKKPHELAAEATYLCEKVKPQMEVVRAAVDKAEGLIQRELYPYPTYEQLIYSITHSGLVFRTIRLHAITVT